MAKFDSKTFNANAFGKYIDTVEQTKKNEMIGSGVLSSNRQIKQAFSGQTGVVYATLPMFARIGGEAQNYDGETDITANTTGSYERGVVVVGRANAWTERDFSEDITDGAGFMSNVARQISSYWEEVDQATLLSILKGIFRMSGEENLEFVNGHTLDITGVEDNKVGAGTLNQAIQKASGDQKCRYELVIMHSAVATNLEQLQLLEYMKYTDKNGVERNLSLATWNGRIVLIDDTMPCARVMASAGTQGVYTLTVSTAAAEGDVITIDEETYICGADFAQAGDTSGCAAALADLLEVQYNGRFTVSVSGATITLKQVSNGMGGQPVVGITGTMKMTAQTTTPGVLPTYTDSYTTYIFGRGAFDYEDVGCETPYEMSRDPRTNGGMDTLYSRQRKVFAPYGISFTKEVMQSNSPTDKELSRGENWTLVHDGDGNVIDHKSIAIARIISRG